MITTISPHWSCPSNVVAHTTQRSGGVSVGQYQGLNLASHVGDADDAVASNRQLLSDFLQLPVAPIWLNQTHSDVCVQHGSSTRNHRDADAVWTREPNVVCAVLTADCLPVLMTDVSGSFVAAIHAGWRGLAGGIIAKTLSALPGEPESYVAWLGPAISAQAFEVGEDVYNVFSDELADYQNCFVAGTQAGKHYLDMYAVARMQLNSHGVKSVTGGEIVLMLINNIFLIGVMG